MYKGPHIYHEDTFISMFLDALLIIARKWNQPILTIVYYWIMNMRYIYTVELYSSVDKMEYSGKQMFFFHF